MKSQVAFEFKSVILKRTVALTVFLVPLALIGLGIAAHPEGEHAWRIFAASWSTLVVVFSVMFAIPTVVADRRDRLVYKRLITSALSKEKILLSGILPYLLISVFQILLVGLSLANLGRIGVERPIVLAIGTIILSLAACTSGLALGSVSQSAERAQWTVLPVVLIVAISANFLPSESMYPPLRKLFYFLPGGSFMDIFYIAFGGKSFANDLFNIANENALFIDIIICLLWTSFAVLVVKKKFRWGIR